MPVVGTARVRLLVAACLALFVLAGCASPRDGGSSSAAGGATTLPSIPNTAYHGGSTDGAPHTVDPAALSGDNVAFRAVGGYTWIGAVTFEPTIGSTSSGALFMTSLRNEAVPDLPVDAALLQDTHVIRGDPRGASWTDVGPFAGPTELRQVPNSNDPFLYVDPWTDRIYNFDMCLTLSGFCVEYSDDDGASWTLISVATGEQPALDHQSLAAAPPGETGLQTVGYDNLLVFCVNRGLQGGAVGGPYCSTSLDGGIAWTPLTPGFPVGTAPCSGLHGHLAGSSDGRFYRGNPACGGPAVYRSDDGGLTWSEHIINPTVGTMGHEISVAVDSANNLYAFWVAADGLPYLAASSNRGDTWGPTRMVGVPGVNVTGFPTIAAGAPGRVAFAYIGAHVDGGYEGDQENANWTGYLGVVTDAFAADPLITTVAVNAPDDPLSHGACGNVRCGGFGDFIDITIDPEGRPWAALAHNGHDGAGIVGTLLEGPRLVGDLGPLEPIVLAGPGSFS